MALEPAAAAMNWSDGEGPDFMDMDRGCGLELTAYHQDAGRARGGNNERAFEEIIHRIIEDAKVGYESLGRAARNVFAFPTYRPPKGRAKYEAISSALIQFVASIDVNARLHVGSEALPAPLDRWFEEITITPKHAISEAIWMPVRAALMHTTPASVQTILGEKEKLISNYRKRASEVWLLVYSGPMPMVGVGGSSFASAFGPLTDEIRTHHFVSSFDKVFFFDIADQSSASCRFVALAKPAAPERAIHEEARFKKNSSLIANWFA